MDELDALHEVNTDGGQSVVMFNRQLQLQTDGPTQCMLSQRERQ